VLQEGGERFFAGALQCGMVRGQEAEASRVGLHPAPGVAMPWTPAVATSFALAVTLPQPATSAAAVFLVLAARHG